MLELEPSFMPAVNFLEHHPQISERNRYILLDWLLEVRFADFAYCIF